MRFADAFAPGGMHAGLCRVSSITDNVVPVGVQLAADDERAAGRIRVVWIACCRRLKVGQCQTRVVDDLRATGLVDQLHRTT